jgi:hypothetical protein
VGCAVGRGVATTGGRPSFVAAGVGVGTTATIGPSVGSADAGGSVDGPDDGTTDGATDDGTTDGATDDGVGPVPSPELEGVGSVDDDGAAKFPEGAGLRPPAATSSRGRVGATTPVVSATVARMRFRSPMATTRRAR